MSGRKGVEKKENVEDDDKNQREKPSSSGRMDEKKKDKTLRFQPPSTHTLSEESFSSALSKNVRGDVIDETGAENFSVSQISIFQKFVHPPLPYSQSRKPFRKLCFKKSSDYDILLLPESPSQHLFEILSDTPNPNEENIQLIKATYLRKIDDAKEAIENGADVNVISDSQTPLLIATEVGDDRLVAYFLTVPDVNPDFQNNFGQTPIIIAVRNSFVKIVKLLLNYNADVNIVDNMGKSPLHGALFQQRPNLVKLLLAYGADVEREDCFGERPLYTSAVKKPCRECLLLLLKMGAAINYINFSGIPLLSRTILNGTDFSLVETLVQYGADVNAQDLVSKKTPLHFAAIQNNVRVINLLIANGAKVNIKTAYKFTPLDEALCQKNMEAAECLRDKMKLVKMKGSFSDKPVL